MTARGLGASCVGAFGAADWVWRQRGQQQQWQKVVAVAMADSAATAADQRTAHPAAIAAATKRRAKAQMLDGRAVGSSIV